MGLSQSEWVACTVGGMESQTYLLTRRPRTCLEHQFLEHRAEGAWPTALHVRRSAYIRAGMLSSLPSFLTPPSSARPTCTPLSSTTSLTTLSNMMQTAALLSLTLAAVANAKTFRAATTSPYGQSSLNLETFNTTYGVAISGRNPVDTTIRADLDEAGNLVMECPYAGYVAALIPTDPPQEPAAYHVQFVESTNSLPEEAIVGGWALSYDRKGLANEAFVKVNNTLIGDGMYTALQVGDDAGYFVSWLNDSWVNHFDTEWYLVFDSTEGAATC